MLAIKNLTISFPSHEGPKMALSDLSLSISRNQIFGLMGESGSGKTLTALSILGLLPFKAPQAQVKGEILYENKNLLQSSPDQWHEIRWKKISMIFQNPFTFFNPTLRLEKQFREILREESRPRISELLKAVSLQDETRILKSYPHELSGGQLQRLMIALALLQHPQLMIADEPTTALDANLKYSILELLKKIKEMEGLTLFIISHDLEAVSTICDSLGIIFRGFLVEYSPASGLLQNPLHPYTQELLKQSGTNISNPGKEPLLEFKTQGCPYTLRCPHTKPKCNHEMPPWFLESGKEDHRVRCWIYENGVTPPLTPQTPL
ncbi:MAG: ABC transporter ATP-binding protein [Chlamydiae bacterium]|nr:ABC transporter ATP-binding protein [Chlamydiota bacterium]MBI3278199.1 ABC transporter ATP-binding protein [Chlamydiota bacterium]